MENLSDGAPKKEDPPPEDETNEKDENLLGFAEETVECIPERRELIVEEPMALDCIQEEIMMCYDMPRAFHIQDEHGFAYQSDLETDEIVERPLVKQELLKMPETVEYIPERRVERRPTVESTMHDAVCIQQQMIFYDEPTALPLQEDLAYQSETACVQLVSLEKFTPLFAKERVTEQEVYIMGQIQGPFLKSNASLPKKRIPNADERYLNTRIHDAEKLYLMSCTQGVVDERLKIRCCNIATAIYLDDDPNLRTFLKLQKDTTDGMKNTLGERSPLLENIKEPQFRIEDIQRRILEAVELNSLSCLHALCEIYQNNPISNKAEDIHLFHRRYGLSFWPLSERPKETALHLIANKHSSIKAMKVLQERPQFLNDFSDIPDSHGSSPLLLAIKRNNMEVVKVLLDREPDVNKRNKHNESPILVAALNDHADVIKEMLEKSNLDETKLLEVMKNIDGNGHSILYPASQSGKPKVLNLIMEQRWWQECFDQEVNKTEEWESFVGNVCASGCYELARICLQHNNNTTPNEKGDEGAISVTPLMRAVEANQGEIVKLIIDRSRGYDPFMICDEHGKNVFHYAVKNPDILCYLLEKLKELGNNTEVINIMDEWENTPIKLAAVGDIEESFEMLLEHTTNKADLFAAHLIDSVDIELLKKGLVDWKRKDPKAVADLLNGEHEKHQPFLEAAKKGKVELLQFFWDEGANYSQRTPEDQTVLHYAVLSGELAVVEFLLEKNEFLEMIDFTDEINISAAGYATKLGKAEILRYMLEKGAQIKSDTKTARLNILDCAYGHFETAEESIKEIIEFCTTQKKVKYKKTQLLKELFEDTYFGADRIMAQLIEKTPEVAMMIFDLCVQEQKYHSHRSYGEMKVERRMIYLFFPFKRKNPKDNAKDKGQADGKLEAIESMVDNERDDCLGHPLVLKFLNYKMHSKGVKKWFYFNVFFYLIFLLSLTVYSTLQSQGLYDLKSPGMISLSVIILAFCAFHFIKEIFQFGLYAASYTKDFENYIEWVIFICAVIYVVPGGSTKTKVQITAGVISVFLGWINFSFFLKRFSLFGIYVIMAKRVFRTVCQVLPFVLLFIVAFSLSFSLLIRLDKGFKNIPISILTTFVMMTGELDYRDIFLQSGPFHVLQKIVLVLFILTITVTVMNLLTGLAVGDINDIMARSKEEKRISKASLVITLERNLHNIPFLPSPEFEDDVEDPPKDECQPSWLTLHWNKIFEDDEIEEQLKAMAKKKKKGFGKQLKNEMKDRLQNIEALLEKLQAGSKDASSS